MVFQTPGVGPNKTVLPLWQSIAKFNALRELEIHNVNTACLYSSVPDSQLAGLTSLKVRVAAGNSSPDASAIAAPAYALSRSHVCAAAAWCGIGQRKSVFSFLY